MKTAAAVLGKIEDHANFSGENPASVRARFWCYLSHASVRILLFPSIEAPKLTLNRREAAMKECKEGKSPSIVEKAPKLLLLK